MTEAKRFDQRRSCSSARRKRVILEKNRSASERSMREADTAELPRARRAWMGPPPATLGLTLPRDFRGPHPEPLHQTSKAVAKLVRLGPSGPGLACGRVERRLARGRTSKTSRDGVAHEAPLSPLWRGPRSARRCELHASTRARLEVGAP